MKKITSFLSMVALCCLSAFAQEYVGEDLPKGRTVKIGVAQETMVPGQWYFLHSPRNPNSNASAFAEPGGNIQIEGGLVTDQGLGKGLMLTTKAKLEELASERGALANDNLASMVRFVEVEGAEGAFNIEFGTGNWLGAAPGDGTVSATYHKAGEDGKYNFYLIENNGVANTAGRFGWNKYDMANKVDNNGAGNNVVFWESGKITKEVESDSEVKGNNVWQIYSIELLEDADPYVTAITALESYHNSLQENYADLCGLVIDFIENGEAEGIGNEPGNYKPEYAQEFGEMMFIVADVLEIYSGGDIHPEYPEAADVEALDSLYRLAWTNFTENRIPRAITGINSGYYWINSAMAWTESVADTVYYTQEEADEYNQLNNLVEGDSAFVTTETIQTIGTKDVAAATKSIYSGNDNKLYWAKQENKLAFLWKIEAVAGKPMEYRLINMLNNMVVFNVNQSGHVALVKNDTATVSFDYWGTDGDKTILSIRPSNATENSYKHMHAGGHNSGKGKNGTVVGWEPSAGATQWYLAPVAAVDAEELISGPEKKLMAMIAKGDSIAAAFPAQKSIALDKVADCDTTVNIASEAVFFSPYNEVEEGSVAGAFDNDPETFWHANWHAADNDHSSSTTNGTNFFVIKDTEAAINGGLAVKITRRKQAQNDHLLQLTVFGSNDEYDVAADITSINAGNGALGTWTELGVLDLPFKSASETLTTNAIEFDGSYAYYKFLVTKTDLNRGFTHFAEFALYPATVAKRYETVQADVRAAELAALDAAVATWTEKGFSADSLELATDASFQAAYDAIVKAGEAWAKVFVDPTALRTAIANAPDTKLFVTGNNPGEWAAGVQTPTTVIENAEAYNASGAYTPAESENHIKAINTAVKNVWAAANKVQTNQWYSIKFPSEDLYDEFEWSKTGAEDGFSKHDEGETQISYYPLFDKKIAIGDAVKSFVGVTNTNDEGKVSNDTITTFEVVTVDLEEVSEGANLFFFDAEESFENGEDLFRFIQVTDTSYMIQNKATGLFVRGLYPVQLSATPSLVQVNAMGAGACAIRVKSVLDKEDAGYNYLHAQRDDSRLTTWDSNTLGSNTMLMIEPVESVSDVPSVDYTKKMWPGQFYTQTLPVETTVKSGAVAYGATMEVEGTTTTITLMTLPATDGVQTVKAGVPHILIADNENDFISYADRYEEIAQEVIEEYGDWSKDAKEEAYYRIGLEYAEVEMSHGMAIDTVCTSLLSLKGTMEQKSIESGKCMIAEDNSFKAPFKGATIGNYGAYIVSDFEANSDELLNTVEIKIEGSIDTGINEVISKVAQSGNIYNAAGQLVGKGNINTINNLPAGIYVVNGVKVTKK